MTSDDASLEGQAADFLALAPGIDGNSKGGVDITVVGNWVWSRAADIGFVGLSGVEISVFFREEKILFL